MIGNLVTINLDVLPLGAVEIDENFLRILPEGKATFENERGDRRTFRIDRKQRILEGTGIHGFFRGYESGNAVAVPKDGAILLEKPFGKVPKTAKNAKEHEQETVSDLWRLRSGDKKWFELSRFADEFTIGFGDTGTLISLPQLRGVEPHDFQIRTVKQVLCKYHGRVLLCDEVGLGKTIEAGTAMMEYIIRGLVRRILILTPPSLVGQWQEEMMSKFNQDFIRSDSSEFRAEGDSAWKNHAKVISSINIAKRKSNARLILPINYDLVIVDEAHHLRNRNSVAWQFVNRLHKKYIFLLTATPVQNNLEELYNLITLLKPGQFKTYSYFKKRFVKDRRGLEAKNTAELRHLLDDVMIRNRRSNVDVAFPDRRVSTIRTPFTEPEQTLYAEVTDFIRKHYDEEDGSLSRLTLKNLQEEMGSSFASAAVSLEHIASRPGLPAAERKTVAEYCRKAKKLGSFQTCSPKLEEMGKIIENFKGKMIVFTKYRETLETINSFLQRHGVSTAVFHGGLRRKQKEEQIQNFRGPARVLVSTEAGGEGRNLQFCNALINYDLPWNPMQIEQRIGRIHRIGQTRTVFVYNLAAAGTVEDYILDLLDQKINMFELVVGETDMLLGNIEDKSDFSEIIMRSWVQSSDIPSMEKQMKPVEEELLKNRKQIDRIHKLDDTLFSETDKSES